MRRFIMVLVLAIVVAFSVTAAAQGTQPGSFAVGINLGMGASASARYRMDGFDINANLGYGFLSRYLSAEGWVDFKVTEFDVSEAHFWVTVGGGAYTGFILDGSKGFGLAAIAPVSLLYALDAGDVPLDIYLRFIPGLWIRPDFGFYYDAYVGAQWRFN